EQPFGDQTFDVVVGSGLFFLPHALWDAYVGVYVAAMFACCRRAVAVNFLSAYSTNKDPESYYATPHVVLERLQQQITPRVVLRPIDCRHGVPARDAVEAEAPGNAPGELRTTRVLSRSLPGGRSRALRYLQQPRRHQHHTHSSAGRGARRHLPLREEQPDGGGGK